MPRANRYQHCLYVSYDRDGQRRATIWHHGTGLKVTLRKTLRPSVRALARYCRLIRKANLKKNSGIEVDPFFSGWSTTVWRARSNIYTMGQEETCPPSQD